MSEAIDGFIESNLTASKEYYAEEAGRLIGDAHVRITGTYRKILIYDWSDPANHDPTLSDSPQYSEEEHRYFDSLGSVNPD